MQASDTTYAYDQHVVNYIWQPDMTLTNALTSLAEDFEEFDDFGDDEEFEDLGEYTEEEVNIVKGSMDALSGYHDQTILEDGDFRYEMLTDGKACQITRYTGYDEDVSVPEKLKNLGFLEKSRDLFLIQCYTGLAYADLMDFNIDKIYERSGLSVLAGKRTKTGADYIVVVMSKTMKILEKYDYKLPRISNQKYNDRLKLDYDDCSEGRRLEHEKDKYLAEIQQKNNEIEKKTKVDMVKNVIYGLGTAAGIGLAMLGRKDEREGFITDNQTNIFDRFRKMKP